MSKIYIVRDYDDGRILGAFDNKEKLNWFLNEHEDEWPAEEYKVNDTNGLRIMSVYDLVFYPESPNKVSRKVYSTPTYVGYYKYKGKIEGPGPGAVFVEVQADSLDEAIERAKSHAQQ
jgi:hypothetical protein